MAWAGGDCRGGAAASPGNRGARLGEPSRLASLGTQWHAFHLKKWYNHGFLYYTRTHFMPFATGRTMVEPW